MRHNYEHVYVLHCPETGLRKIGITTNLNERFHQLQAGSAYELDIAGALVLYCIEGTARIFEAILHDMFKHKRTHGEWFKLDTEDLKLFDQHIVLNLRLFHRNCDVPHDVEGFDDYKAYPTEKMTSRQRDCRDWTVRESNADVY